VICRDTQPNANIGICGSALKLLVSFYIRYDGTHVLVNVTLR